MPKHWDDYSDEQQLDAMGKIEASLLRSRDINNPIAGSRSTPLDVEAHNIWEILEVEYPGHPYSIKDIEAILQGESFSGKTKIARNRLQERINEIREMQRTREALGKLWEAPEQSSDSLPYSLDELLRTSMDLAQHGGQLHYEHSTIISGFQVLVTVHTPFDPMPPASGGALTLTVTSTPLPRPVM